MRSLCLQSIYNIQKGKHRRWAALLHVLPEKPVKRNASTDVWLSTSTSKAIKLPGLRLEACSWSDARSWVTRGSWMGEGWKASFTIANDKSTGSGKCKCKTSSCLRNCSCNNTGLSCTEGCYCMADDEVCKNPHGVTCISDSEESDQEWKGSRKVELFDVWRIFSTEQIYKGRNIAITNLL